LKKLNYFFQILKKKVILQFEIGVCRKVHAAPNRRKAVLYFPAGVYFFIQ